MGSEVISFRLTEAEIEALKELQDSNDKSLNQTAARLIRSLISGITPEVYTDVDKLEERINEVLVERLANINQVIGELQQEVKELRGKLIAR
jgi:Mg2+ and Co2+ transporter CorA